MDHSNEHLGSATCGRNFQVAGAETAVAATPNKVALDDLIAEQHNEGVLLKGLVDDTHLAAGRSGAHLWPAIAAVRLDTKRVAGCWRHCRLLAALTASKRQCNCTGQGVEQS